MSVPPFGLPVDAPLHEESWRRPPYNHEFRVTQRFDNVNEDVSKQIHGGTDVGSGQLPGRNAYAMGDGYVIDEGELKWPWSEPTSRYPSGNYGGIMAVTRHGRDWITALAHLNDTVVDRGQTVKRGQLLGHVGKTGIAAEWGTHLHIDCYQRMQPGMSSEIGPIYFDGAWWRKVDVWPLLAQNFALPSASIAQVGDVMLKAKAEGWKTGPNGADIRETPGGKVISHVAANRPVTTLGETLDGKDRLAHVGRAELGPFGALAYIARADLVPNAAGGDPDFDEAVWTAVELRRAPDPVDGKAEARIGSASIHLEAATAGAKKTADELVAALAALKA